MAIDYIKTWKTNMDEAFDFKSILKDPGPFRKLADRHDDAAANHSIYTDPDYHDDNEKPSVAVMKHHDHVSDLHGTASNHFNAAAVNIEKGNSKEAEIHIKKAEGFADQAKVYTQKHKLENFFTYDNKTDKQVNESKRIDESLIVAIENKDFANANQLIEAAFADVMAQKFNEMKKIIQARGSVSLEQVFEELNDPAKAALRALSEGLDKKKALSRTSAEPSASVESS